MPRRSSYLTNFSTKATPQSEQADSAQVKNSAGGFSFQVDEFTMLRRFLVLGTEGGSYYASERDLTKENAKNIIACIKKDGLRTVQEIVEISDKGRAPKNDPALFALALCTDPKIADERTRNFAIESLPKVARIPTHLFHFAAYMQNFRGWGRLARRGVANWYLNTPVDNLAFHVAKYGQRDGWSHADLLRLAHPKTEDTRRNSLFKYIVDGIVPEDIEIIRVAEVLKNETNEKEIARLIKEFKLPMEVVPTERRTKAVYEAVLPTAGTEWVVRNLGNLSKHGILTKGNFEMIEQITNRITNPEVLKKSRMHPIKLLAALLTYKQGHGTRGGGSWEVVNDIVDALDTAFYAAFGNVEPSGKRTLWGMDVSSSMTWGNVSGVQGLTPHVAQAALAMVTYHTEKKFIPMAFSDRLVELNELGRKKRLDDVIKYIMGRGFGGTDCSLPMQYATKNNLEIDTFIVSTDSETWAGSIHPHQALEQYRQKTGIPAKLVVVGMIGNKFSIANPNDAGMLDVVGFDTATPELISAFSRGDF